MTIDQIISLGASIGALLAAVGTFLTVREIAKQRHTLYRPELILSGIAVEAVAPESDDPENGEDEVAYKWATSEEDARRKSRELPDYSFQFSIPLTNVGIGAAKRVHVSWSFPVLSEVDRLNKALVEAGAEALFEKTKDDYISMSVRTRGFRLSRSWEEEKEENIDYVLPISTLKDPVQLPLPPLFILLASAIFYVERQSNLKNVAVPRLVATIEFDDIAGRRHRTAFDLMLEVSAVGGRGRYFGGYLYARTRMQK